MNNTLKLLGLSICLISLADAQSLSSEYRTNGTETRQVFEPLRQVLQNSSAVLYRGSKRIAYASIVSEDGYLLTKASEIESPKNPKPEEKTALAVRVGEGVLYKEVQVVAVSTAWDVALLKIDAKDLIPVNYADHSSVEQGSWVVMNGASSRIRRRVKVGIISANTRAITGPIPVVIGVSLKEKDKQLVIEAVGAKSGAEQAGLKKGDIVIALDGQEISTRADLQKLLSDKEPKDVIKLKIERSGESLELPVTLQARPSTGGARGMSRNDMMSGRFSQRRDSFDRVLQVDIPTSFRSCGGPLINLEGQCIGMVIARANRAETFVIPLEEMKMLFEELKAKK